MAHLLPSGPLPAASASARRGHPGGQLCSEHAFTTPYASVRGDLPRLRATAPRDFGADLKRIARQVQGALPIVGLLSRLSAPGGGVGSDNLAYPEYCRIMMDRASQDFQSACTVWEERYGKVGQRRYVLLYLWIASEAGGLVPGKPIVTSALRLRVTHDLEMESERLEQARNAIFRDYKNVERPKGKIQDKVNIAVDALCRLSPGLKDGEEVSSKDEDVLRSIVAEAFSDEAGIADLVTVSLQQRKQRISDYTF